MEKIIDYKTIATEARKKVLDKPKEYMQKNHAETAKEIRKTVLSMIYKAQVSHLGSNFSCIDILTVLYSKMNPKKDKLIVSKGWVAASVYALNVKYGYMPQEAVDTYCDGISKYIGLIEPIGYFGCEVGSGSMGMGLPAGVGFALAKKLKNEEGNVWVLMSDGELQCGTTWESLLIAAKLGLHNLCVIVDYNGFQAMGKIDEILQIRPIYEKFRSFRWFGTEADGHSFAALERCFDDFIQMNSKSPYQETGGIMGDNPYFIIAHTIKGKGWKRAENNNLYHYKNLSKEEYNLALKELNG